MCYVLLVESNPHREKKNMWNCWKNNYRTDSNRLIIEKKFLMGQKVSEVVQGLLSLFSFGK